MIVLKDKIIYNKGEYINRFIKNEPNTEGYHLLKTQSDFFQYGVNKVPISITRNPAIENGHIVSQNEINNLVEVPKSNLFKIKILQRKIAELYDRVKIFKPSTHFVEDSNIENFTSDEFGNTIYIPPLGYSFDYQRKQIICEKEVFYNNLKRTLIIAYLCNNEYILCEKALGEKSYLKSGILLSEEDINYLEKNTKL